MICILPCLIVFVLVSCCMVLCRYVWSCMIFFRHTCGLEVSFAIIYSFVLSNWVCHGPKWSSTVNIIYVLVCSSIILNSLIWSYQNLYCPLCSFTSIFIQSVSLTQYVVLSVRLSACLPACLSVPVSLLSKRPSSYCLIHFGGTWGAALG